MRESKSSNSKAAAIQYFEAVLQRENRNVEALFGKAKYYEASGLMDKANEVLSTLVVLFNYGGSEGFAPPLVEKMKVELSVQDWDQAEDTANRVSLKENRVTLPRVNEHVLKYYLNMKEKMAIIL